LTVGKIVNVTERQRRHDAARRERTIQQILRAAPGMGRKEAEGLAGNIERLRAMRSMQRALEDKALREAFPASNEVIAAVLRALK
jgi:hypothetical protein